MIKGLVTAGAVILIFSSVPAYSDSLRPPPPKPQEFVLNECQSKLVDFTNSDTLPASMWPSQGHYETIGFEFKQKLGDDSMHPDSWLVRLPQGWSRMMEDDMNEAFIIDSSDNKRVRVNCGDDSEQELIADLLSRYRVEREYLQNRVDIFVMDGQSEESVYWCENSTRTEEDPDGIQARTETCWKWLDENYSYHDDPLAYWSD